MQVKSVWLRTKQIPGNSAHCTNVRRTNFNINFRINDKEKRCMPIIALNLHADYFISKIFVKHFSSMKIVLHIKQYYLGNAEIWLANLLRMRPSQNQSNCCMENGRVVFVASHFLVIQTLSTIAVPNTERNANALISQKRIWSVTPSQCNLAKVTIARWKSLDSI